MDIQTIDNQYNQLQAQARQTVEELKGLAQKLGTAAQSGNQDAREWFLDLKSIALAIQAEQNQVANLLQAIHDYAANQAQNVQQLPQSVPQTAPYPPQGYPPQPYPPGYGYPNGYPNQNGFLGGILNSGFGRALVAGAGFGIGDDLINRIF